MESIQDHDVLMFKKCLKNLNIELNELQIKQFMEYYELLIKWNKVMNLTAITDLRQVIQKHYIDSLSIVKVFRLEKEMVLDIGTGAGFPGVPLKIAFPDINVVLLDSLKKRLSFLDEVILNLNLKNIKTIHGRAEDYGRDKKYREKFDICVSRAVGKLPVLSEYCIPFIKQGGVFISYKSGEINIELKSCTNAIKSLGASMESTKKYVLPYTNVERSLIIIKKTGKTPLKYPRKAGKPVKNPL